MCVRNALPITYTFSGHSFLLLLFYKICDTSEYINDFARIKSMNKLKSKCIFVLGVNKQFDYIFEFYSYHVYK